MNKIVYKYTCNLSLNGIEEIYIIGRGIKLSLLSGLEGDIVRWIYIPWNIYTKLNSKPKNVIGAAWTV